MTNSRDIGLRGTGAGKGDAPRHNQAAFRKGYEKIRWSDDYKKRPSKRAVKALAQSQML